MMLTLFTVACGSGTGSPTVATVPSETPADSSPVVAETATQIPAPTLDTGPFEALNPLPEIRGIDPSIDFGFDERDKIPRDAINPVYTPKFATAAEMDGSLLPDELVMGLSVDGDARAYPVGIMRFREMVNDVVGGVPLLVTW